MVVTLNPTITAVYTDGACSGNPGPGGWGVVIQFADGGQQEFGGKEPQTTNNRMELQAAIEALKALSEFGGTETVTLYTDSEYVINGITKWLVNWKKKGWKTAQGKAVLNQDLWQTLDELHTGQVQWRYVRGHAGHPGNERADAIARAFSLNQIPHLTSLDSTTKVMELSTPNGPSMPSEVSVKALDKPHWFEQLQRIDTVANRGYWLTDAELAELVQFDLDRMSTQPDQWTWRNWLILRVRPQGHPPLWQLQRQPDSDTLNDQP
jgi:ribonuclease HI